MLRVMIRYGAYPLIGGSAFVALVIGATLGWSYWPMFPLIAAMGLITVAALERVAPYEPIWLHDHGDLATDLFHNLVNLSVVLVTVEALYWIRTLVGYEGIWPVSSPVFVQVLLAGAVIDLGLYAMHRFSHANEFLWRLHATHHSAERLYWLNGERRHPLSAVALAAPGITAVVALGAPPVVIAAWLTFLTVHLGFQHANLDYRLGPLRRWLGVAEIHRWHHKREFEDAQVNFGEFWMVWDRLFGTFHDQPAQIHASDVGLRDPAFPRSYWRQLVWPFRIRVRDSHQDVR